MGKGNTRDRPLFLSDIRRLSRSVSASSFRDQPEVSAQVCHDHRRDLLLNLFIAQDEGIVGCISKAVQYALSIGLWSCGRIITEDSRKPWSVPKPSVRSFPPDARQDAGRQLELVQRGQRPNDSKPMATIGQGVEELRIWDEAGTFRVIYTARLADAIYVLHAFRKKTQTTAKREIEIAGARFDQLTRGHP
ncbi:MAG: type II toxin-antitoxin system RelE/ParE family toxin [Thiocapsa sp.]|nr:MAG: type II toxin-antitoxin system RelE/ParE family toxin [Thiocapsa sp.]